MVVVMKMIFVATGYDDKCTYREDDDDDTDDGATVIMNLKILFDNRADDDDACRGVMSTHCPTRYKIRTAGTIHSSDRKAKNLIGLWPRRRHI